MAPQYPNHLLLASLMVAKGFVTAIGLLPTTPKDEGMSSTVELAPLRDKEVPMRFIL